MPLTKPIPFLEAIGSLLDKRALPTNLGTAELRELGQSILERSLFSARTNNEWYVERIRSAVQSVLNPVQVFDPDLGREVTRGFNSADARLSLKQALEAIDYAPDEADRGTIKDLSSDQRIDLVVRTQTTQAHNVGKLRKLQDPNLLAVAPALELARFTQSREPRDWIQRFRLAGSQSGHAIGDGWTITPGGRMVALVNHPIWDALGDPSNFDDAIGTAYPPFAFNSGMDWMSVDIDDAEGLGILGSGGPQPRAVTLEEGIS